MINFYVVWSLKRNLKFVHVDIAVNSSVIICDSYSNESRNASVAILWHDIANKDELPVDNNLLPTLCFSDSFHLRYLNTQSCFQRFSDSRLVFSLPLFKEPVFHASGNKCKKISPRRPPTAKLSNIFSVPELSVTEITSNSLKKEMINKSRKL